MVGQHWRVELDEGVDSEVVVGEDDERGAGFVIADLDFMLYNVEDFFAVLAFDAGFVDFVAVDARRAVEDWQFGRIDAYEAVVDSCSVESRHGVFDCADAGFALGDDCASGCLDHIFGEAIDDGLVREVDALDFTAVVLRCGKEFGFDVEASVKTLARHFEWGGEGELVDVGFCHYFCSNCFSNLRTVALSSPSFFE